MGPWDELSSMLSEGLPPGADVFPADRRAAVDGLKPSNVEDDAAVQQLSKAFGSIERGINEARSIAERVPDIEHEACFVLFDELADHAYEAWRRLIYNEPMLRWVRRG